MDLTEISCDSLDVDLDFSNNQESEILIDFSTIDLDVNICSDDEDNSKYSRSVDKNKYKMSNGYEIEYDKETNGYYRAVRKAQVDPILEMEVDDKYAFKFPFQWDPYTGKRGGIDPYGPLYFDPDSLIKHFFTIRLNNLWINSSGEFEGHYGDALGNGPDFEIKGRGIYPEYYIFRLPIIDCYLTKDNNEQNVTFGPKLNDDEIVQIYNLAKRKDKIKGINCYKSMFRYNRPDLLNLKKYWDMATSQVPHVKGFDSTGLAHNEIIQFYEGKNREAVNYLRRMRG